VTSATERSRSWLGPVIVTGTDARVGKTVVTAAIAAAAMASGLRVAVVKPARTGAVNGAGSDVDTVRWLAGPATGRTLASYADNLGPRAAALVGHLEPLTLDAVLDIIRGYVVSHDLVLVEGSGGLLVPIGDCWTIADLAVAASAPTVVVTGSSDGAVNHAALTMEALERRGVPGCVVLGAWPAEPDLGQLSTFVDLAPYLAGVLPEGAASLEPGVFRRSAASWLSPILYGAVGDVRDWLAELR